MDHKICKICKCCKVKDVMEGYEQGICPFCGELYCFDCMKTEVRGNINKCFNCKTPLRASDKKVYKGLEKLRTKYHKLQKSRPLDKYETLILVATLNCLVERFVTGTGTPENHHLARKMCREVMELDNPTGHYNLYHLIVDTNPEEGIKLLRKSVEMGFNKAMLILAVEIAADNNHRHTEESEKLLKQAALTGLPEAEYQLALAYHLGTLPGEDPDNTGPNQKRAAFWYRRAAEHNHPSSLNNLGLFYKEGIGCIGDMGKALNHFERSMALGCKEGGYGAGTVYEEIGDFKKASQYYSRASLMNCAPAMFRLGILIVTEKVSDPVTPGGSKPTRRELLTQGLAMIEDAASRGHQEAKEYLELATEQLVSAKAKESQPEQPGIVILPPPTKEGHPSL